MSHSLEDVNRRDIDFNQSIVKDVLPEYFLTEYPNLVLFLEKYYEYLDGDERDSFETKINDLFTIRDIQQTSLENLDNIIKDVGNGLQVASFFQQPRLMAKLITSFYSSKGTLVSAEGFFRAFFNEEVTIEYPKNQMFIVNESQIGYESQRFIQDDGIYQVFSILIKIGLSVPDYKSLYDKFVHPAGWHFQGQVATEEQVSLSITTSSENPLAEVTPIILVDQATNAAQARFSETTALIDSDGTLIRVRVDEPIEKYQDLTVSQIGKFYDDITQLVTPNSFKFDDSDGTTRPDTSLELETMDNNMFTAYGSDSAI